MKWGQEKLYKIIIPEDSSIKSVFLPNDVYIEKIKVRLATYSWLVLPDSKCFGTTPSQPYLPPVSESRYDHPLPDYAVLNDEPGLVNKTGPLPDQAVDRCLVVDTYRSSQLPHEMWAGFC